MGKTENLQEKSARILEFDKIRQILAGFTASKPGEELAHFLAARNRPGGSGAGAKETTEARELWQTSRVPLDGIFDLRAAAEGARRGKVLSPEETPGYRRHPPGREITPEIPGGRGRGEGAGPFRPWRQG